MKKTFRNIKKFPSWLYTPLVWLLRIWYMTMRKTVKGSYDPNAIAIHILWHNRILFSAMPYTKRYLKRTAAVISPSRDGQYIADIMSAMGLSTVRGSSSKKAAKALHTSIKAIEDGANICITPDGPRGPIYQLHKGAVHLASKTGKPIIPFSLNASSYWQLKSWDRFQIPKPFCKLEVIIGEPIHVPADLDDEQSAEWNEKVQQALMDITKD